MSDYRGERFTSAELLHHLRDEIEECGSQKAAAAKLGISAQYLNDVLQDRREIGPTLAEALGFRRVVMFEEIGLPPVGLNASRERG